ncbi:MAG TPA: hypothetical protein VHF89_06640 [Solirubrobacteraceae bacterium]|nr:hypothetical protein [Solirubrobacteraceae bacterium]
MPRQIVTLRLDGITAGDYLAHVRDPEPPAAGLGLRSMTVRAEPLGELVEAVLDWEHRIPAPAVAARAAGLPLTAEVAAVEAVPDVTEEDPVIAKKLADLADRAAAALLARPRPGSPAPLVVRWA